MHRCVLITAALLVAATTQVAAQNLVVNPEFDTDFSGWYTSGSTWSAEDWQASPSSGSVTNTNYYPHSTYLVAEQCIELTGPLATTYQLSAQIYLPSGQPTTGYGRLSWGWFASPACTGWVGGATARDVTAAGTWQARSVVSAPPPSAVSTRIGAYLWADAEGGFQAHVDHVALLPTIFSDDLESGDTSSWSSAIP